MDNRSVTNPADVNFDDLPVIRRRRKGGYRTTVAVLVLLILLALAAGGAFGYCAYQVYNHVGIYDGVSVAGLRVDGLSRHEAAEKLESEMRGIMENMNFNVVVDDQEFEIEPSDIGITYSVDAAAAEAYRYGRSGSFSDRVKDILKARTTGYDVNFNYSYNLDAFDSIAKSIADQVNVAATKTTYEIQDDSVVLVVGNAARTINPLDISKAMLSKIQNNTTGDLSFTTDGGSRDEIDLQMIKSQIDCEAKDAYLDTTTDPENPVIVPEVDGKTLDLALCNSILAGKGTGPNGNTYTLPITVIEPEVKRDDIVYFTYDDLLATAKTTLNPNNVNRTSNIKLACQKIDGTILYPGDEFSFNKTVGERTYATGFKDAAIYLAGEIADGVGGGICQVSSTLYMTAVGADLEISQRKNHRYTVTYTELGSDATVAYGSVDFKFVNNTDYAIMIRIVQESNYVLCEFYGTLTDENRNKTVSMEHTVTSYSQYSTIYQISDSVQPGHTSSKNGGYNGYTVQVYRVVKQNGKEVSRTLENTSTYSKLDKIIYINAADAKVLDNGSVVYSPGGGTKPAETDEPAIDEPGTEVPGTDEPGTDEPGTGIPGIDEPGTEPDPGTQPDPGQQPAPDPGTQPDPGQQPEPDPGTQPDPGQQPEPEPVQPAEPTPPDPEPPASEPGSDSDFDSYFDN